MIISHKYRFIYIRNPKTGSTSIENYLKRIDPDCIYSDETTIPYGHQTYEQIKNILSDKIFNNYYKFGFMRNPKDWFVSQYVNNMVLDYSHERFEQISLLLNDGKLNVPDNNLIEPNDFIIFYIMLDKWFNTTSQLLWINEHLDFIGKFENLIEDFEKIKKFLNINNDEQLPKLNNNNSYNYQLSEETEKIFNILYKKDIDFYNSYFQ